VLLGGFEFHQNIQTKDSLKSIFHSPTIYLEHNVQELMLNIIFQQSLNPKNK
jgi:hypothetical protein